MPHTADLTVLGLAAGEGTAAVVEEELGKGGARVRWLPDLEALVQAAARERGVALVVDLDAVASDVGSSVGTAAHLLRADFRTAPLPLVLLLPDGVPVDELLDLCSPADDVLAVADVPGRLYTRLAWAAHRAAELSPMAAMTGLPGLVRSRWELRRRMGGGEPFAYCRLDLTGLADYNRVHGHARGDQLVLALAGALRRVAVDLAPRPFVSHLYGDDFLLLCRPEQARPACRDAADMFEADTAVLYEPTERERRALEVVDRTGFVREAPLVAVSAGVATNEHRSFADEHQVVAVADEMLRFARQTPGSSIGVDRRRA